MMGSYLVGILADIFWNLGIVQMFCWCEISKVVICILKNYSAFFTESNFQLALAVSYWFRKFKILYHALLSIFIQILVRVNVSMGLFFFFPGYCFLEEQL